MHQVTSAFFAAPDQVERVVVDLVEAGVPRDLVEVIVSPEANKAHYGGRARRARHRSARRPTARADRR